jgi:ferritin-like metal-binding protein YciE
MEPIMADRKKLADLFHDTLKDVYFAEKKIVATLPKMQEAAISQKLKDAFTKAPWRNEGPCRTP